MIDIRYIVFGFFLTGAVALVVGLALYDGEVQLMTTARVDLPPDLPIRISWPGFLIGAVSIGIGLLLLVFDRKNEHHLKTVLSRR